MVDFVTGTITVFNQTTAPTGWTKINTYDDCALRVVNGSVTTGGSLGFSSCMSNRTWSGTVTGDGESTVGATTLTSAQIPSHTHLFRSENRNPAFTVDNPASGWDQTTGSPSAGVNIMSAPVTTQTAVPASGAAGGGGSHTHPVSLNLTFNSSPLDFSVNYVDLILASKN